MGSSVNLPLLKSTSKCNTRMYIWCLYGHVTTANLDMQETCSAKMIGDFLVAATWAICSTSHTVLKLLPGTAVFGRDMLIDNPYIAHWTAIGNCRQASVDQMNTLENSRRVDFDYAVGQKVLLKKMVFSARLKTNISGLTRLHRCIRTVPLGFNAELCQNALILGEPRPFLSNLSITDALYVLIISVLLKEN